MAQQREETTNGKGLVAALEDVVVHRMMVEEVAEEADGRVDGDEQQDADDVALLPGLAVVRGVQRDEDEADEQRDAAEDGAQQEAEVVEGEALPQRDLVDGQVREGAVAGFHRAGRAGSMRRAGRGVKGVVAPARCMSLLFVCRRPRRVLLKLQCS